MKSFPNSIFKISIFFIASALLILPQNLLAQNSIAPSQPIIIERQINGESLYMESAPNHAGAFTSMKYRGQEYIDKTDHGRLFQGAIAYNGRFECNNPTQAGASRDEKNWGKRSSSKRLDAIIDNDGYFIVTQMAYWLRPKQECIIPGQGKSRVDNTKRLSDTIYWQFGEWNSIKEFPNIVKLRVSYARNGFKIGDFMGYQSAVVEALTIHTPLEFRRFEILTPNGEFKALNENDFPSETKEPVILSTNDGKSAIAFYSHNEGFFYARWKLPQISKISLVYRVNDGFHGFNEHAYWIIGTTDEVKAALLHLRAQNR